MAIGHSLGSWTLCSDESLHGKTALESSKNGGMREVKKTTRDNDDEGHHGKHGTTDEAVASAQRRALRREAERVLRSTLGIPHSHPLDRNKVRMDDRARMAWSAYDRALNRME